MRYTDNAINVLVTKEIKGIGESWINKSWLENNITDKMSLHDSISTIISAVNKKKDINITIEDFHQKIQHTKRIIEGLEGYCDGIVAIGDEKFPPIRGNNIRDSEKPVCLFYKGDISLLSKNSFNVAVIGLLEPDMETEKDERYIVDLLVKKGATIVSGLAFGCDSIAHDQTLKSNGATVAILPSPLHNILPIKNRGLAQDIVDGGGLLITEYYTVEENFRNLAKRYIDRDRLQALYSNTVILSASYDKNSQDSRVVGNKKLDKGAQYAMSKAAEYGLGQAVIYHPQYISNPKYDLNRSIISTQGSRVLIIDPLNPYPMIDQIMKNDFFMQHQEPKIKDKSPIQGSLEF